MEGKNHNVSMKNFQVFNSPDFRLSQKTEAKSRMASLKHPHAHAVLRSSFFLFEHTIYPWQEHLSDVPVTFQVFGLTRNETEDLF